jgi:hypothetical protein
MGTDEDPQRRQVRLAPHQPVRVVAHSAADRPIGGEQFGVHRPQLRRWVHPEGVGQRRPVLLVTGQRRGYALYARERPQQRDHHLPVPGAVGRSPLQQRQRLGVPALGRQLQSLGAKGPRVDLVGREAEPVTPAGPLDRLGGGRGPGAGHQHLQRLAGIGRRLVGPHLIDQLVVGQPARTGVHECAQERGGTVAGDLVAFPGDLVEHRETRQPGSSPCVDSPVSVAPD